MKHPLDGLAATIKAGRFEDNETLREMNELDMTQNIRKAYLASILRSGELPQPGSDESDLLMSLLATIDKQRIDKEKNELESKKLDISEAIKDIMLANPGRLGSAQELSKRIGGTPDESIDSIEIDHSKLEGFTFKDGELSSEKHGLTINDVTSIVNDYKKSIVEKASGDNSNMETENPNT